MDWYTIFQPGGGRDDTIERQRLAGVDNDGAETVRSLIAHGLPLGARQREKFARFVGWFILRGPALALIGERVGASLDARRAASLLDEQAGPGGSTGLSRSGKRLALPDGPFEFDRGDELELLRRGRAPRRRVLRSFGASRAGSCGGWRLLFAIGRPYGQGAPALDLSVELPGEWRDAASPVDRQSVR